MWGDATSSFAALSPTNPAFSRFYAFCWRSAEPKPMEGEKQVKTAIMMIILFSDFSIFFSDFDYDLK